MVVGELLAAVRDAKLVQTPHEPAGTVEQIELILLAAIDVERVQPPEIVGLSFDRDSRVLSHPICLTLLDDLGRFERRWPLDRRSTEQRGASFAGLAH